MTIKQPQNKVTEAYRAAFLRKALDILARGYGRMTPKRYATWQEPEITGELVRSMKEVIEDPQAPFWMIHFGVADDPPVNDGTRYGKRRRRIDIELFRTERGRNPRLQLEAKRLNKPSSVADYLGKDGLGLFVGGEYGFEQNEGAMLGYIQSGTAQDWNTRVRAGLIGNRAKYGLLKKGDLNPVQIVAAISGLHSSIHRRKKQLPPICIYHTMLRFY